MYMWGHEVAADLWNETEVEPLLVIEHHIKAARLTIEQLEMIGELDDAGRKFYGYA